MKKSIIIISCVVVVLLLSVFLCTKKIMKIDARNQVMEEVVLNDRYKAVIFKRDVGATVDYSYHLSIIEYEDKINNKDKGNIYISDDCFTIQYNDSAELYVYTHIKSKYYKKKNIFKNIHIIYK